MTKQARIANIKKVPFTAKEIDILTGAERYMNKLLDLALIGFVKDCFSNLPLTTIEKIKQVWECYIAAFHLKQDYKTGQQKESNPLQLNAAQIYELEGQRVLGGLFSLEHDFWMTFYKRQGSEQEKLLLALDALHFSSDGQAHISYQLLLQSLKAIIKAHYLEVEKRKEHYQKAKRLVVDLPLPEFQDWLNQQPIKQITHVL